MTEIHAIDPEIAGMPRGGWDASWLDRRLQTDELEYLDRDDVSDEVKQKVVTMLDRMGELTHQHDTFARVALDLVSDIPDPRILELGAGHGKLSAKILELHPTATVTVSDVNPNSVANIAGGPLGSHPRARIQVVDATDIDSQDDTYDLVVLELAFHHLPPLIASRAIAEATRVGTRFLVVDLRRLSPVELALTPLQMVSVNLVFQPLSSLWPCVHDGFISALRAYSISALTTLGQAADPDMSVTVLPKPAGYGPPVNAVVFSRQP